MKTISVKPKIKLPNVKKQKLPNVGMRTPRIAGVINPFRINK